MIELAGVSKTFRSRQGDLVHALEDVTLRVEPEEFVSIVGPSGCGKSTLLRLVGGLTRPSRGVVRVRGAEVREPFPDAGFVFQSAVLLPWRTVVDNVLFSMEMLGERREAYRARALELIELAGLRGFEGKYPWELSGGMQQRVAICRALVHDPGLLLMERRGMSSSRSSTGAASSPASSSRRLLRFLYDGKRLSRLSSSLRCLRLVSSLPCIRSTGSSTLASSAIGSFCSIAGSAALARATVSEGIITM